jgi:hypothetical protein
MNYLMSQYLIHKSVGFKYFTNLSDEYCCHMELLIANYWHGTLKAQANLVWAFCLMNQHDGRFSFWR